MSTPEKNKQLVWKRILSNKQEFPSDAVLVDGSNDDSSQVKEMSTYIGLVDLQRFSSHGPYGDIVPGYVQRQRVDSEENYIISIYYSYNGKAIKADADHCALRILTNPTNLELVWVPSKNGDVPKNAVQYTFIDDECDAITYIGRTIDDKIIGHVQPYNHCLCFPIMEKNIEKKTSEYEVLCIAEE